LENNYGLTAKTAQLCTYCTFIWHYFFCGSDGKKQPLEDKNKTFENLNTDIVLDKNLGPLILELNARPGLAIQIANKTGAVKRFDKIDAQVKSQDISKRVAFSMNHFAVV